MDKPLAIGAILTALVVAIALFVRGEPLYFIAAILPVIVGIMALFRRDGEAMGTGIALIVAGFIALAMLVGNLTFRGGASVGTPPEQPVAWGAALTAAILVPAGVAFLARMRPPTWIPITAAVGATVAILFTWINVQSLGEYWEWTNWLTLLGTLVAAIPAVALLREPSGTGSHARATD